MSPESKVDWLGKNKTPRELAEMYSKESSQTFTYRNQCAELELKNKQLRAEITELRTGKQGWPPSKEHPND